MKIRPVGAELFRADRRTDMTNLIVCFHTFASSHKTSYIWMTIEETNKMDTKSPEVLYVISGFCRGVNEIFALLECYTAYIDSYRRIMTTHRPIFKGQTVQKNQKPQEMDFFTLEYGTDKLSRNVSK